MTHSFPTRRSSDLSGFGIGLNDATIKATVTFLQPGGSGSIDGEAKYGSFFGVLNAGKLTWQGPAEILAGGYKYTLAFENLKGVATGYIGRASLRERVVQYV